ncbi:MAG TPA: FAD-binding oxidoreductase [Amnibacterium sp.]|nr:FAD-binding oxidoreductase [Amnibacterium sp.]
MVQILSDPVEELRSRMRGRVITAADPDYDEARRVWNAAIDRSPKAVAMCETVDDVVAAVTTARDGGLEISVRCGAHNMSGSSVVDGGVVIDLRRMNRVSVDPEARTAIVGGGALLSELDGATQAHGLAVPAGIVSHTGVGGLALGGGMGHLSRLAGLTIDNLVRAEVVTASGEVLTASAESHPDLFWALRGGGGNFGVVTEFEFRLHPVGPMIAMGLMFWDVEHASAMLRFARDLIPTLPADENVMIVGMNAPLAPFVPPEHQGRPGQALLVVGFGDADEHAALLERIRTAVPPTWEFATPMPYTALQQMLDEPNAWGLYDYDRTVYLEEISDEVIDVLAEELPRKQSPLSIAAFYRLDRAYSAVADGDTAFSGRRAPCYALFLIAVCPNEQLLPAEREWVQRVSDRLKPLGVGRAYVNGLTDTDPSIVAEAYGQATYDRLAAVKRSYDPANLFHRNHNILPAD